MLGILSLETKLPYVLGIFIEKIFRCDHIQCRDHGDPRNSA